MLFGVGGYATSGKDSLVDVLEGQFNFQRTFTSKPLHDALLALNPQVKLTYEGGAAGFRTWWRATGRPAARCG